MSTLAFGHFPSTSATQNYIFASGKNYMKGPYGIYCFFAVSTNLLLTLTVNCTVLAL